MKNIRYLKDKDKFLKYAYLALADHFPLHDDFIHYFNAIKTDEQKNRFLETASFYLFLVKNGDWHVDIPDSNKVIDYLTNTYKYVTIFSLIESLSEDNYIDFYEFLVRKKSKVAFPIFNKDELEEYYKKYKDEFGSIRRCVTFFQALSLERQQDLISKLTSKLRVMGAKPVSPSIEELPKRIEELAKYLYELRSKFVHEAELVLPMLPGPVVSLRGKKLIVCELSIDDVMRFFEEGLLIHFGSGET